ncbi:MAG: DUF3995 domain-containing protein [Ornithinibacter sp.]
MSTVSEEQAPRPVPASLGVAAVLGILHAAVSLYWAAGGTALLWSLGTALVERFAGREWLLVPIGLAKLGAALAPLMLARCGWPARRVTRAVCWLGAACLVVWGGLNTVVGQLVLSGVIDPHGGYDRPGMIGHALLWDPLFLFWGAALVVGLSVSRSGVDLSTGTSRRAKRTLLGAEGDEDQGESCPRS